MEKSIMGRRYSGRNRRLSGSHCHAYLGSREGKLEWDRAIKSESHPQ